MSFPKNKTATGTYCQLEATGDIRPYDICYHGGPAGHSNKNLKFIGMGIIYSVNGIRQHDPETYWFYEFVK